MQSSVLLASFFFPLRRFVLQGVFLVFFAAIVVPSSSKTTSLPTSDLSAALSASSGLAIGDVLSLLPFPSYRSSSSSAPCATDPSVSLCLGGLPGVTLRCVDVATKCVLDGEFAGKSLLDLSSPDSFPGGATLPITVEGLHFTKGNFGLVASFYVVYVTACTFSLNNVGLYLRAPIGSYSYAGGSVTLTGVTFTANLSKDLSRPGGSGPLVTVSSSCPSGSESASAIVGPALSTYVLSGALMGSLFSFSCPACPFGSYRSDSFASCQPCPSGTYNPDYAGAYAAHAERASCLSCSDGQYAISPSLPSCSTCSTLCPAGSSCGSSSSPPTCSPCQAGKYEESSGICVSCPAGTYLRVLPRRDVQRRQGYARLPPRLLGFVPSLPVRHLLSDRRRFGVQRLPRRDVRVRVGGGALLRRLLPPGEVPD